MRLNGWQRLWVVCLAMWAALVFSMVGASMAVTAAQDQTTAPADPTFEVASVKRTRISRPMESAEDAAWAKLLRPANRLADRAAPLRGLIQLAYGVWGYQIEGAPRWVSSDRFEIDARTNGNTPFEQIQVMLRALLADRFKLVVRRETRTLPAFELVPESGGLKIEPLKPGGCVTLGPDSPRPKLSLPPAPMPNICGWTRRVIVSITPSRVERIEGAGVTLTQLIEMIAPEVERPIIDRTGFTEKFTYQLDFAPAKLFGAEPGAVADLLATVPYVPQALKEQLGLELKPSRGPVDVLVVEHVEQPSDN